MKYPKNNQEIVNSYNRRVKNTTNPILKRLLLESALEMVVDLQKPKSN